MLRISKMETQAKWQWAALMVLIVLQLLVMLYFASEKKSYHVDELYSYGLSNSYYRPFINRDVNYNTWLDRSFFEEYYTVQPGERFAYGSVYYNQTQDVHPPLYYFFVHTACSLVPDTFSKWPGILLNMLFFIASNIVLFLLASRLLKSRWLSLIPCAIWGFSAGAISSVVFIRMYVLLTLLVLCLTHLHCVMVFENRHKLLIMLQITLVNALGFLTQYYFIIYAFFLASLYLVCLWIKRRWSGMLSYAGTMLSGLATGVIVYPASLNHIFSGYRGKQAFSKLTGSASYSEWVLAYYKIINDHLFFGKFKILLIILVILLGLVLLSNFVIKVSFSYDKAHNKLTINTAFFKEAEVCVNIQRWFILCAMIAFAAVGYVFAIARIAPYRIDRYVFCVYPLILLCFFIAAYWLSDQMLKNKRVAAGALLALFALFSIFSYKNNSVGYLYKHTNTSIESKMQAYAEYDSFFFHQPGNGNVTLGTMQMMWHDRAYIINDATGAGDFYDDIEASAIAGPVVVYFSNSEPQTDFEAVLNEIIERTRFEKFTKLFDARESGTGVLSFLLE